MAAKSPELVEAQIDSFALSGAIEPHSDEWRLLYENMGTLIGLRDLDDAPAALQPLVTKYRDAYSSHVAQKEHEEIGTTRRYIERYYREFEPVVTDIKKQVAAHGDPKNVAGYLGGGAMGSVFRRDVHGEPYAIKLAKEVQGQSSLDASALLMGEGIPRTAQLAAYSPKDNVVVMDLLPGKDVTRYEFGEEPHYTDLEISQFMRTLCTLRERGLIIDTRANENGSNALYDPQSGLGIVDYHRSDSEIDYARSIIELMYPLSFRRWPQVSGDRENAQKFFGRFHHEYSTILRLLNILKKDFQPELALLARQYKQGNIPLPGKSAYDERSQEMATQLENPMAKSDVDKLIADIEALLLQ